MMMISLEVEKMEPCILWAMMTCLEVWKFGILHVVCDDDTFGSWKDFKFAYCV